MQQLPLHGRARLLDHLRLAAREAHHFERAADRRQRVAQFVRERGEELILPAIGLAQGDFGQLAIGEIDADAHTPVHLTVGIEQRLDVVLDVRDRAVGPHQLDVVADEGALGDRHLHRELVLRQIAAVPLNVVVRRVPVRGRHRNVLGRREPQQRRQRAVRGDEAALRIVGDGDRDRRRCDQSLERT